MLNVSVTQSLSLSHRIKANCLSTGFHPILAPTRSFFFFFFTKSKALLMRLCNDINGSIRCERRREPINAHRGAQRNPRRDNNITITKSDVSGSSRTAAPAMCARSCSDFSSLRARTHTDSHFCCCCCFSARQVRGPVGPLRASLHLQKPTQASSAACRLRRHLTLSLDT